MTRIRFSNEEESMGKESNSTDSEKVVTIFSISLSKKVDISMYWREEDEEDEEVMTLS
jgi:hypothetical protein